MDENWDLLLSFCPILEVFLLSLLHYFITILRNWSEFCPAPNDQSNRETKAKGLIGCKCSKGKASQVLNPTENKHKYLLIGLSPYFLKPNKKQGWNENLNKNKWNNNLNGFTYEAKGNLVKLGSVYYREKSSQNLGQGFEGSIFKLAAPVALEIHYGRWGFVEGSYYYDIWASQSLNCQAITVF